MIFYKKETEKIELVARPVVGHWLLLSVCSSLTPDFDHVRNTPDDLDDVAPVGASDYLLTSLQDPRNGQ